MFQVKVQESVNVLTHLCSAVMSIGLVVLVFGQSYSSTLLWLYGGSKLTSYLPILLMRAHCLAILLLGINGVTECYTNATADSATINKSNWIMIYESIAFLGASYLFAIWFGPVGFILGNCVNMSLRILHSTIFINRRYKDTIYHPLRGLVPKPIFSASLLIAALVTTVSHVKESSIRSPRITENSRITFYVFYASGLLFPGSESLALDRWNGNVHGDTCILDIRASRPDQTRNE